MSQQNRADISGDKNFAFQGNQGGTYIINQFTGQQHFVPHALTLIPRPALVLGREDVIAEIHAAFEDQRETLLVNGMGGIGKTTVALHYLDLHKNDYTHIAHVEVIQNIRTALAGNELLRQNLGLKEVFENIPADQIEQQGSDYVLNALNTLQGNTLLVLDNANDAADLLDMRPRLAATNCRVLITTRAEVDGAATIRIEELPPDLALALFEKHCPIEAHERPAVEAILKKIHYHTLLIEHLARAVKRNGMEMDAVLRLLEEGFVRHPDLNVRKIHTGQHAERQSGDLPSEATPVDYLRLLFREIGDLDEDCQQVLHLCSLLPSQDYTEAQLLDFFLIPKEAEASFADTLDRLTHGGWLARKDGRPPQWKLHALLQDVVKHELKPDAENCASLIKSLKVKLTIDQNKDNPATKFPWLPYGEFAVGQLENGEDAGVAELQDKISWVLRDFGDYKKAAHYGEQALAFAEKKWGKEHQDTARYQSNLAGVFQALGRYEGAAELYEKTLAYANDNLGQDHHHVAIYQSNLADVYRDLGRYEEAAELLRAALDSDLKNFGNNHSNVARCQSNLAVVYWYLGRYEEAAELLREALDSDLKNFGKEHPNVAIRQSNLASVYQAFGRYEEAADLLRAALDSDLKNFGKDHPNVATDYNNLGWLYLDMNKPAEAKTYFENALAIWERVLPAGHPHIGYAREGLEEAERLLSAP